MIIDDGASFGEGMTTPMNLFLMILFGFMDGVIIGDGDATVGLGSDVVNFGDDFIIEPG